MLGNGSKVLLEILMYRMERFDVEFSLINIIENFV